MLNFFKILFQLPTLLKELGLHFNFFIVYINSEGATHFYFLKLYPLIFFFLVVYFLVFFFYTSVFHQFWIIFCNLFQFTFYDIIVVLNKCHVIWFMLDFLRAYFNWIIFIFFFKFHHLVFHWFWIRLQNLFRWHYRSLKQIF
jgi:hypothetical protein